MHISSQLIRTARDAVNVSSSLKNALSLNPFVKEKQRRAWAMLVDTLWDIKVCIQHGESRMVKEYYRGKDRV